MNGADWLGNCGMGRIEQAMKKRTNSGDGKLLQCAVTASTKKKQGCIWIGNKQ